MAEQFFVTGGTGLIGTYLIPRILTKFPGSTLTLLVRGNDEDEVNRRVRNIGVWIGKRYIIPDLASRLIGVRGDIMFDNCGLNRNQLDHIVQSTSYIIHGAATIRFDHPLEEARTINCGGTRRLLALAQTCVEKGKLSRFVYIGTSSVSGQREGDIYEHELEMEQEFFNTYEQSKCESERLVRSHFDRIPATVFRPSIVIGDSRTGHTSSFNVVYIPLRLAQKGLLKFVPGTPDTKMDLVPIDWVDDAMVYIMSRDESIANVFHITAGPSRAATLGELVLRAIRYFDMHSPQKHQRTMEFITRTEFNRRRAAMRGREEALMAQLDTLLPYVSINRLFNSANADRLLAASGIKFPRFADYADKIFEYCIKTNWGKTEAKE